MQADLLINRGHRKKRVQRAVGQQPDDFIDLETGNNEVLAAFDQCRQGHEVDARGMKQRQVIETDVITRDRHRLADVDVVRERHGRSLDDGLGLAGGARGIDQVPGVIAAPEIPASEGLCILTKRRVALAASVVETDSLRAAATELFRNGTIFFTKEQESGRRVVDQRRQLPGRHAPVERHEDGPELAGSEQYFEKLDTIAAQHGDAIAFSHTCRAQQTRE